MRRNEGWKSICSNKCHIIYCNIVICDVLRSQFHINCVCVCVHVCVYSFILVFNLMMGF